MRFIPSILILLNLAASGLAAQNVAEVQVTPETVSLKVGQKQTLFAAAFDASGNLVPTARFTYGSNNPAVVEAQPHGVIIGLKAGVAVVQVAVGQKIFSVAVSVESATSRPPATSAVARPPTVTGPSAAVLTIEPSPLYLLPAESRGLTVQALRDDGSVAELPRITWRSLTPETATIGADGVVVGLAPGTAIIQASAPGLTATVPVEVAAEEISLSASRLVLAPFDLDTIVVTVPAQNRREIHTGLQWRSGNAAIVRVGPTGIVQAMAPGETEIIVGGFFQERRIPVRVHPPVQSLVVTPKPGGGVIRLPLGGLRNISVRAEAANSTQIAEATLWWEIGDSAVIGYNSVLGEISGKGLGTTTLTLRAPGFDPVSWVIEVVPGGVAVDRNRVALALGARTTLLVNLVDDSGAVLAPAEQLVWASDNPNVAVVGNDGVVEATGFGRARLTAKTTWGRTATTDVFVVGDLIYSSNRSAAVYGIYQLSLMDPAHPIPLLVDNFQNVQGALSPDRTTIAFSSNRDGDFDLWLMDADGTNLRKLTSEPGADGDPAWSPDGTTLIYAATRSGGTQLFAISATGGASRQLTSVGGGNTAPAISPDGKTISFISDRDGNDELYRMDWDGGNQRNLSRSRERETSPWYFPNGDLGWAAELPGGGWQILRKTVADEPRLVATDPGPITAFTISPDGQRVAIVAGRITNGGRGRAEFRLSLIPLGGGAPVTIPLVPNEQVIF